MARHVIGSLLYGFFVVSGRRAYPRRSRFTSNSTEFGHGIATQQRRPLSFLRRRVLRWSLPGKIAYGSLGQNPKRKISPQKVWFPCPLFFISRSSSDSATTQAGLYDTLPEDALAVTWSPLHPKVAIDLETLEHHYIRSLHPGKSFFNPAPRRPGSHQDEYASIEEVDPHMPMEQFLAAELSNPHSRAKKQARWQEREQSKVVLKEEFVTREIERARRTGPGRELGGRRVTPSEARRIGEWKWKNELLRLATQEKHRRWAAGGGEETKKRRQERGARKVRRTHERLRQLVLPEAKNQVVPPTVAGQRRT